MPTPDIGPLIVSATGSLLILVLAGYATRRTVIGCRMLAEHYPDHLFSADLRYRQVAGQVERGFSQNLEVSVNREGIRIAPGGWWRRYFGSAVPTIISPMIIPWSAVLVCRRGWYPFFREALYLEIKKSLVPIRFSFLRRYGDAISKIESYWKEYQANRPPEAAGSPGVQSSPINAHQDLAFPFITGPDDPGKRPFL